LLLTPLVLVPLKLVPWKLRPLKLVPFKATPFKLMPSTSSPGPALDDPEKAKESAAVARAIVNTLFFMVKILNCVFKTLPICCNV